MDITYRGYKIGYRSVDWNKKGYVWNVFKDGKNVHFDTKREAKKWINEQIGKN